MAETFFISTAAAMAAIVATWLAIALVLVAIGALAFPSPTALTDGTSAASLGAIVLDPALQLLLWFWTGWAIVVALLQLWHLMLPVDDRALLGVVFLAAAGILLRHRQIVLALGSLIRPASLLLPLGAALVLLIANVAAGQITNYDTGLYHLQAVQWNCDFAIVPGLANLHGRLGFNNASFLYDALLDAGPWTGASHHVANGVLLLSVLLTSLASLVHLLRNRATSLSTNAESRSHLARVMLFAPALLTTYSNITSHSPDLPANLLGIVLAMLLVEIALRGRAGEAPPPLLAPVTLLASAGIAVKLSFLPLGVTAIALTWVWQRRAAPHVQRSRMQSAATIAIMLAILVPWTIRGVVLSGYPIFPATLCPFSVDWIVPHQRAANEAELIVNWARTRSIMPSRPGAAWIPAWAAHQAKDFLKVDLPLAIALGCGAIAALRRRIVQANPASLRLYSLLAAPPLAHLAFLLCTAPDISRFGGASCWLLAIFATLAWLDVEALHDAATSIAPHAKRLAVATTAILAAVALAKVADPDHLTGPGGLRPIPAVSLTTYETQSRLMVIVPEESDQAWAAPLPSSPSVDPLLELREPGNLAAGFRIKQLQAR